MRLFQRLGSLAACLLLSILFATCHVASAQSAVYDPLSNRGVIKSGEGRAYAGYATRTPKQVANLIRRACKGEATELRVYVYDLLEEFVARGLPRQKDCEAYARLIESPDVQVITCTVELVSSVYLARTDGTGQARDYTWSRGFCYKGETFLVYKPASWPADVSAIIFLSTYCVNLAQPKRLPPPPPQRRRRESPFECVVLITDAKCVPTS